MTFNAGQICYIDYGEAPRVVHTRLILGHIQNFDYLIRTPDGDEYIETMDASNPDATAFFVGPDDGSIPIGIPPGVVYGFGNMSLQQLNAILAAGRVAVDAERQRRGLAAVVGVQAPNQLVWILAEWVPGKKIGEQVVPPVGFARDGAYGLMSIEDSEGITRPVLIYQTNVEDVGSFCEKRIDLARRSEAKEGDDLNACEDVRTLEVKFGLNGDRHRVFRDTVLEMQQVEFDDFPLEPRTTLSYLKAVGQVAESAMGQHLAWVQQSKIPDGDRAIHEDEVLARAIDLGIQYDCLNISNLASFELLIRRRQLLADAHSYNPSAPSYEGSDHYMGTTYRPGGAIVVPELVKHVSDRMHQESQIMKERRKQSEMKGKGRGKPFNPAKPDPKGGGGITGSPEEQRENGPRRKALFVGISYAGTSSFLEFCHEDAWKMKDFFCQPAYGFTDTPETVKVLMDAENAPEGERPTKENIKAGIKWLVDEAVAGDSLLFFYSGHGTRVPNSNDREKDGYDEALCPIDMEENGVLIDDELNEILVQPLPAGVRLTCFLDACHSGTGMDLPYHWSPYTEGTEWLLDQGGYYAAADVICVSAAADDETAKHRPDLARRRADHPAGTFISAFLVACEVHDTQCVQNWKEMITIVMKVCNDFRYGQSVQLSSSQSFDLTREFNLHDSIPNSNEKTGPVTRGNGEPAASGFEFWSKPPENNPFAGMGQEEKLRYMAERGCKASAAILAQMEAFRAMYGKNGTE